jgi:acyl carrier protein
MKTTSERLGAILIKDYQLDPASLTLDASLEGLGIDSLGIAELLFNIEDEFGITLPSKPAELSTVGDVVLYIDGLRAAQHSGAALDAMPAAPASNAS